MIASGAATHKPSSSFFNSVHWIGARLCSGLSRAGVLLLIAGIYGPANFGELSLAISLTEILRTISECGVDTIAIRKFKQGSSSEVTKSLGVVLAAKIVLACAGYAAVIGILLIFADRTHIVLLGAVAGLSLFSSNVVGAFTSYFLSRSSMSHVLATTVRSVAFLWGWTAVCIATGCSIPVVIAGIPLAEAINALTLWKRSGLAVRLTFRTAMILELLGESLPVGLMGALVILYLRLDNFFVFRFAGEAALGLYSIAYRSVEPFLMVPHAFAITLYSHLSGHVGSTPGMKVNLRNVLATMWPAYAFAGAAVAGTLLTGKYFLAHWFPSYLPAFPVMRVLAVLLLIRSVNITLTSILYSFGRYRSLLYITGTNLLANLVFASFLIPPFGPLGAAFAAFLTETWNCAAQLRSVSSCISFNLPPERLESLPLGSERNAGPAFEQKY